MKSIHDRPLAKPSGHADRDGSRIALAVLLLVAICQSASATEEARPAAIATSKARSENIIAGWMQYSDGIWVAPWIEVEEHPTAEIQVDSQSPNLMRARLVAQVKDGEEQLASASLEKTPGHLLLKVTSTAKAKGAFHVGQRIRSAKIGMLDSNRTTFSAGQNSKVNRYYPYNWKLNKYESIGEQTGGTAQQPGAGTVTIDLALPGVSIGDSNFVQASNELSLQRIITSKEYAEARLLLTKPLLLPTGDEGSTRIELNKGDSVELQVIVSNDLTAIQDEKWGKSPPMSQKTGCLQLKGWAADDYNLPPDDLKKMAAEIAKGYDTVNFRTMAPEKWVLDIFKSQGLKIFLYQFWGAVRTLNNDGTQLPKGVRPEWVLRETQQSPTGMGCRAPNLNGGWQLLNVRNPEVRRYFVNIARKAVEDGWDGVFYDGPYFWADSKTRVGGNGTLDKNADQISYSLARAKMTLEIKQAMLAINPAAKLGILAPRHYFDQLHIADYVDRENTNTYWAFTNLIPDRNDPLAGRAQYSPSLAKEWLEKERPFIKTNLCYGTKSINPLLVTSAVFWADEDPKNVSIDDGDAWPKDDVLYAKVTGEVGKYFGANRIKEITPDDTIIYGTGFSLIETSKSAAIRLEHPAAAFNLTNMRYLGNSDSYRLEPGNTYVVAERAGKNCLYSGERFAWFGDDLYLVGDMRFSGSPEKKGDSIVFHGEGLKSGTLNLHSTHRPKAISSNGKSVEFKEHEGFWEFEIPAAPTVLQIDF